jgi:hypothetical protein
MQIMTSKFQQKELQRYYKILHQDILKHLTNKFFRRKILSLL